ncbi:TetR-like C-terminal domain-containing protein [Streptomyces sp. NPDC046862]|uniref:TetR-like C-terminal domain-containing protein n=1 Tax=Streptomyces sp. NPDC046862 TaxID=3154603 RepID=UPI0034551F1C
MRRRSTRTSRATGSGRPTTPPPPAALRRALTFWTRLHGLLSLELAGHFTGMGFDPAQLYASEVDDLSAQLTGPGPAARA